MTCLTLMAHSFISLNKPTRYTSVASCRVPMVTPWNHMSDLKPWAISRTSHWKGSLQMRSLVILQNQQISLSAMVPGLNWHGHGMALALCASLPPCEGDFCLGIFLFWACYPRASLHSFRASLACWALARKAPRGSVPWTSPGPLRLFPWFVVWLHLPPWSQQYLELVTCSGGRTLPCMRCVRSSKGGWWGSWE